MSLCQIKTKWPWLIKYVNRNSNYYKRDGQFQPTWAIYTTFFSPWVLVNYHDSKRSVKIPLDCPVCRQTYWPVSKHLHSDLIMKIISDLVLCKTILTWQMSYLPWNSSVKHMWLMVEFGMLRIDCVKINWYLWCKLFLIIIMTT